MSTILLVTPPLVQINTPYPATAFLKGFLESIHVSNFQIDLGLELICSLFSSKGLSELRDYIYEHSYSDELLESDVWLKMDLYSATIDAALSFLQNKNPTLAYSIVTRAFLPEGHRFLQLEGTDDLFGINDIQDKARYLATLYIEDICDFIRDHVDEHFGLSRYAESIARSAHSFDELYEYAFTHDNFIMDKCYSILRQHILDHNPQIIAFTIPFPGNLTAALCMSARLKKEFDIKVVIGGGYCNTELRQVTDPRLFEIIDYMTFDDGERPLESLIHHIVNDPDTSRLVRTFTRHPEQGVVYYNNDSIADYSMAALPAPSYRDLRNDDYISVIDVVNPMHRLWSDGRWNKMILAHGCYWAKCTFCDITLSYIADYHHAAASKIVDDIEHMILETGHRGFHFVDEAAPPALIRDVCIELLRRNVKITWWTNIRFEKSFTSELCQLMVQAGCIAVSGGLEVASNRLLKLIQKGVTVEQVAQVCHHFTTHGILVHAYLMYGFPTQTEQETIDALEMVRQLFQQGILESAYWHRFTMTIHSPCGRTPELFKVSAVEDDLPHTFAQNDVEHIDPTGAQHEKFHDGLNKALYNYMHKNCLDWPLQEWFDFKIPKTTVSKRYIAQALQTAPLQALQPHKTLLWLGLKPRPEHTHIDDGVMYWTVFSAAASLELELDEDYGTYLYDMLSASHFSQDTSCIVKDWKQVFVERFPDDNFDDFMLSSIYQGLNPLGLIYI